MKSYNRNIYHIIDCVCARERECLGGGVGEHGCVFEEYMCVGGATRACVCLGNVCVCVCLCGVTN